METIGTIFQIAGILIALGSLALCLASNFWGILGSVIGFALAGFGEIIYINDEDKLKLATETYQKEGEILIIKTHQESLGAIYDAAMEIAANSARIQQVHDELEQKSKDVTSNESKMIFQNKLEQLDKQKNKLKASLQNLESCAFEQVLVKHMENTPGANFAATDIANNIKDELETVRQIMKEVEKIDLN